MSFRIIVCFSGTFSVTHEKEKTIRCLHVAGLSKLYHTPRTLKEIIRHYVIILVCLLNEKYNQLI